MNIQNYETFLEFLMEFINKKFDNQKEYISCSKGCALCCKTVSIPFSELEFEYLMEGYKTLSDEIKAVVDNNIKQLKNEEKESQCPFLINNVCSVYKYRGLICRTFGLLIVSEEGENTIPFCIHKGLNYSTVYDEKTNTISEKMVKESGLREEPKFYPLNRTLICNLKIVKELGLEFGSSKKLIEFLRNLP